MKRDEWITAVTGLCADVKRWSEARGWWVQSAELALSERRLGDYTVPALMIALPGAQRLHLDPIGADIIGADGRVDLLIYPSLNRMILLRRGGEWRLFTDSMVEWPLPWDEDTFVKLVAALPGQ